MSKVKEKPICMVCKSHDALFITLKNGERLPCFTYLIGQGIICPDCKLLKETNSGTNISTSG